MCELLRERWLEGVADGRDSGAFEHAEKGARDGGEEVAVFVGVDVSDSDACVLQFTDLGVSFALDLLFADAATQECLDEVEQGGAEGSSVGAEQR